MIWRSGDSVSPTSALGSDEVEIILRTFDVLYILDLGGNPVKNLGRSDPDENVFDIRDAGVAIALFVKTSQSTELGKLYHNVRRGTRSEKEHYLFTHSVDDTEWKELAPVEPDYLFVPRSASIQEEWDQHEAVTSIFTLGGPGVKTNRDNLTIHFTEEEAWSTAVEFVRIPEADARERWKLPPANVESKGWHYESAKADLILQFAKRDFNPTAKATGSPTKARKQLVRPITYRPFDIRWTVWTGTTQGYIAWPSTDAMKHYLNARDNKGRYHNLGLVTARQNASGRADHFFVTRLPTEMKTAESTRGSLTFPLYKYLDDGVEALFGSNRETTLSTSWATSLAAVTGLRYTADGPGDLTDTFGPEDALAYVYGVLYAPSYRQHFIEQLRSDYARIPLPPSGDLFRSICRIGHRLIGLHTGDPIGGIESGQASFPVAGTNEVENLTATGLPPRYTPAGYILPGGEVPQEGRVWLQAFRRKSTFTPQYFAGVDPNVWNYTIGGHQVLLKWLRARIGRVMTVDDLTHFLRTANALHATLELESKIDVHVRQLLGLVPE